MIFCLNDIVIYVQYTLQEVSIWSSSNYQPNKFQSPNIYQTFSNKIDQLLWTTAWQRKVATVSICKNPILPVWISHKHYFSV